MNKQKCRVLKYLTQAFPAVSSRHGPSAPHGYFVTHGSSRYYLTRTIPDFRFSAQPRPMTELHPPEIFCNTCPVFVSRERSILNIEPLDPDERIAELD